MIIAENQITRELLNRHKFEFAEPCVSGEGRGGGYVRANGNGGRCHLLTAVNFGEPARRSHLRQASAGGLSI